MRFGRKKKSDPVLVQTAPSGIAGSFGLLSSSGQLSSCEKELYRSLRNSVPVIDAAIGKILRLSGGFQVRCQDADAQKKMDHFLYEVRVNGLSKGIESFITVYLDQLLTYGTAVGEIVLDEAGHIAALYNSSLDDVTLCCGDGPLDVRICRAGLAGQKNEVRYPGLIMCSALMPEPGRLYGTSLLRGLPFVGDILLKIFSALGNNWDRIGNVRFSVSYKPTESDRSFAKDRAMQIASEWSKAMKSREPRDFISVGDVTIKAIGADQQIPDSQIPVRLILEQIVSKLGIPPFLLGLTWATTEKMSSQQADILTSELEYYRRLLASPLRKICSSFMKLEGCRGDFEIVWDSINLQDEVELSKARLNNARAEEIEIRNGRS